MTYDDVTSRESLGISAESEITQSEMITQTDKSVFKNMPDSAGRMRQKAYVQIYVCPCFIICKKTSTEENV